MNSSIKWLKYGEHGEPVQVKAVNSNVRAASIAKEFGIDVDCIKMSGVLQYTDNEGNIKLAEHEGLSASEAILVTGVSTCVFLLHSGPVCGANGLPLRNAVHVLQNTKSNDCANWSSLATQLRLQPGCPVHTLAIICEIDFVGPHSTLRRMGVWSRSACYARLHHVTTCHISSETGGLVCWHMTMHAFRHVHVGQCCMFVSWLASALPRKAMVARHVYGVVHR